MKKVLKHIMVSLLFFKAGISFGQATVTYQCILRSNAQEDTLYDGTIIPIYGITSLLSQPAQITAKTLYCKVGDSVVLDTKSISQHDHHTIHLHGLDVDTRNDGDPSTSFALKHMQDTTYSFKASNAGTFLYHCHVTDVLHVQMGMYGLVVVKSHNGTNYTAWPGGPVYHDYRNWLMSEVDTFWHNNIPVHDTIADTMHIDPYRPTHFLINGRGGNQLLTDDSIMVAGSQNETIYIRTANIGYTVNRIIVPSWLNNKMVDSDGRPLPGMISTDTVYIMPGERFGLLLQPLVQGTDTILVQYVDMNTGVVLSTGKVPVMIDGIYGVDETAQLKGFKLFPNPTVTGQFTLVNEGKNNVSRVEVFNASGEMVFTQKVHAHNREINVNFNAPSNGIYIVKVYGNKQQAALRMIVSK